MKTLSWSDFEEGRRPVEQGGRPEEYAPLLASMEVELHSGVVTNGTWRE